MTSFGESFCVFSGRSIVRSETKWNYYPCEESHHPVWVKSTALRFPLARLYDSHVLHETALTEFCLTNGFLRTRAYRRITFRVSQL